MYQDLARFYDQVIGEDYTAWAKFLSALFDAHGDDVKRVLDVACGTGSLLHALHKLGYTCDGADLSADMLALAQKRVASRDRKRGAIKLYRQDMSELDLPYLYDALCCIVDSVNYLTDPRALYRAFRHAYDHLSPNGLYVVDIATLRRFRDKLRAPYIVECNDITYTLQSVLQQNRICRQYVTWWVKEGDLWRRYDELHKQRIYLCREIIHALRAAGFCIAGAYEAFGSEIYQPMSPHNDNLLDRVVFVGKKIVGH